MNNAAKVLTSIAALGAAGALVAGCGSSSSTGGSSTPSSPPPATTTASSSSSSSSSAAPVSVSASATALAFDKTTLTATAGDVTFDFNNPASLPHNLSIRSADGTKLGGSDTVTGKAAAPFTVKLAKGTYTFYCSVPGHEAGGMKGTLTVK